MNLHIFLTPCVHESRFLKESASLAKHGVFNHIKIAALGNPDLPESEEIDPIRSIWRIRLVTRDLPRWFASQLIKYVEWVGRMVWGLRGQTVEVVHVHSLGSLPAGIVVKSIKGAKLIYDAHELESEKNGDGPFRRKVSRVVERALLRFVDQMIVVTDSIADWYEKEFHIERPIVVRNVPNAPTFDIVSSNVLKETFGIDPLDVLFIYQGRMSPGRNICGLLRAFEQRPSAKIVFMGYGPLVDLVKEYAGRTENIFYHEAVPPKDIVRYTSSADIGVAVPENNCLSHYYGLGNKHFEYLLSGLALLVSDFPERRKLVDTTGCGWAIDPSEESICEFIDAIDLDDVRDRQKNAVRCRADFSWEQEETKLLQAYSAVMGC